MYMARLNCPHSHAHAWQCALNRWGRSGAALACARAAVGCALTAGCAARAACSCLLQRPLHCLLEHFGRLCACKVRAVGTRGCLHARVLLLHAVTILPSGH